MISEVYNMDCMEYMKDIPDKFFDLAVVDPPYGIGEDGKKNHSRSRLCRAKKYTPKEWDSHSPDKAYFHELMRVSKEQVIFGANHFISNIPFDSSCWIVWDKDNGNCDFADCELAWTSFTCAVRKFTYRWNGMLQGNMKKKEKRIHPTQKPVALYEWIFSNFAKKGDKILDTHLGSGSSRIAAWRMGLDFFGTEIDKEYFDQMILRFRYECLDEKVTNKGIIKQLHIFD